jgi:hypothetical protein
MQRSTIYFVLAKNSPIQAEGSVNRRKKGGQANFFVRPQIANPKILGLIPQSHNRKFLVPVCKWQIRQFFNDYVAKLQI